MIGNNDRIRRLVHCVAAPLIREASVQCPELSEKMGPNATIIHEATHATGVRHRPGKSQYNSVFTSNGFKPGRSESKRATMPARCGAAQLVAGSWANGPR